MFFYCQFRSLYIRLHLYNPISTPSTPELYTITQCMTPIRDDFNTITCTLTTSQSRLSPNRLHAIPLYYRTTLLPRHMIHHNVACIFKHYMRVTHSLHIIHTMQEPTVTTMQPHITVHVYTQVCTHQCMLRTDITRYTSCIPNYIPMRYKSVTV